MSLNSALCTLRFLPSLIRHHPFKDDSLIYRLITVSNRGSTLKYGYAYVPQAVADGAAARVHIVLHGCKQGYNYIDFTFGQSDFASQPPYGNRYVTTTGYNNIADSNNIIVLYPQAEGTDDSLTQNPDGCWDWWGYSSADAEQPDYYSRDAIQIRAIHGMLSRLGG